MGCGQSKIDKIYPRKRKRRGCNKLSVDADVEDEGDDERRVSVNEDDADVDEESNKKATAKVRQPVSSGPLLAQTETSSSQLDFFRLLDEKIENGPDYDATSECELSAERSRVAALLRDWESASRSLPSTPGSRKTHPQAAHPLHKQFYRPSLQQNGDVYYQHYHLQQQQQQLQQLQMRGQFFTPQYPRYPPMSPKYHVPLPQPQASVVQYRKSRGVYTELA